MHIHFCSLIIKWCFLSISTFWRTLFLVICQLSIKNGIWFFSFIQCVFWRVWKLCSFKMYKWVTEKGSREVWITTDTIVWFVHNNKKKYHYKCTRVTTYFTVCQFIYKNFYFDYFTYRQYTYIAWIFSFIYLLEI